MTAAASQMPTLAPLERVPTWFNIGGGAARSCVIHSADELAALLATGEPILPLGDGANLLVHDDDAPGIVAQMRGLDEIAQIDDSSSDETVRVRFGAGVQLPRAISWAVKRGLAGLETLGGIPARMGGAVAMNAGGKFGQLSDVLESVEVVTPDAQVRTLAASDLNLGYRTADLHDAIVTSVTCVLRASRDEAERETLSARFDEVRAYKRATQPMGERSAGCLFRNPTIEGERVSAGMLIDRAGCKGLEVGGARVSDVHANFVTTSPSARAQDVIDLARTVRERVERAHSVLLVPEVVLWSKRGGWGW